MEELLWDLLCKSPTYSETSFEDAVLDLDEQVPAKRRPTKGRPARMPRPLKAKDMLQMRQKAFESEYIEGEALAKVDELLREARASPSCRQAVLLWQSTGWGKSRLLKELAGRQYMVYLACGESRSSWPRATTWGRQLVELLTRGLDAAEQAVAAEVDFQLLVVRARAFLAGVRDHMLDFTATNGASPADWYKHQLSTITPITPITLNGDECRNPSAEPLIVAVDEAQVLVQTPPFDDEGMLLRVLIEACTGTDYSLVFASSNGKVRSLMPLNACSVVHDLSVSLPVSTQPITAEQSGESEHLCQFGRPLWYALHRAGIWSLNDFRMFTDFKSRRYRRHATLGMLTGLQVRRRSEVVDELVAAGLATLDQDADGEFTCSYPSEPLVTDRALAKFRWHFSEVVDVLDTQREMAFVLDGVDWADLLAQVALLYVRSDCVPVMAVHTLGLSLLGSLPCDAYLNKYVNYTRFERTKGPVTAELLLEAMRNRVALHMVGETEYSLVLPYVLEYVPRYPIDLDSVGGIFVAVGGRGRCGAQSEKRLQTLKKYVSETTSGGASAICWLIEHNHRGLNPFEVTDWDRITTGMYRKPEHARGFGQLVERRLTVRLPDLPKDDSQENRGEQNQRWKRVRRRRANGKRQRRG